MAKTRITINQRRLTDLALKSEGVRNLVEQEGVKRQMALGASVGNDNVDGGMGGISRARYTIWRLEHLSKETADGKLLKTLGGGL